MTISRYLILLTLGIWISWIDLRTRRIPNSLLLTMLGLSSALYIFNIHVMAKAFVAALIFGLLLVPLTVIRMRSLGAGDSKLILVLAILLGSGDRTVSALVFASCFALIQIALIYLRSRHWPKSIPFAPALIFGALLSV